MCISVRNSPRQSTNAEAFAEAYLHFIVFASAIKMPRQLNSYKLEKIVFLERKKNFFCKRKKDFLHKKKLFYKAKIIHVHLHSLFIPSFRIFLTHYCLSCYALNEVIDVIHFFLSKQISFLLNHYVTH